jgi:hypothetical protein
MLVADCLCEIKRWPTSHGLPPRRPWRSIIAAQKAHVELIKSAPKSIINSGAMDVFATVQKKDVLLSNFLKKAKSSQQHHGTKIQPPSNDDPAVCQKNKLKIAERRAPAAAGETDASPGVN